MAKVFAKYNFSGVSSAFIIATIVEHATPLAEVDREVLTAPYEGSITFDGLNPVMHRVRFYESTNGTTLGNLLISLSIDATIYNEPSVEIITFKVGAGRGTPHFDPVDGSDYYSNPNLDGATFLVSLEGTGPIDPDILDPYTGGGFQFNNGRVFTQDEVGIVTKYLSVSTVVPPVLARPFEDIIDLSANITFNTTHYNTFLRADFSGSVGTITFPAHASIPNYTKVKISTHGGNQNYVKLQFNGSETTKFFNSNKNVIYLAKGEEIELTWKSGACYVTDYKGNYLMRGKVQASYDNNTSFAFLRAHVDTGVLFKTDYPGLYEWIESLPAGVAVALANWNDTATINGETKYPNRSRFAIDTATESFRVPHLANLGHRFLKLAGTTDAERVNDIPGGYQGDALRSHTHGYKRTRTDAVGTQYETNRLKSAGERGLYTGDDVTSAATGGSETRGENYADIPFIYL